METSIPPPPPPPSVVHISPTEDKKKTHGDLESSALEVKQTIERLPSWRLQSADEGKARWLTCNQKIKYIGQQGTTCGLVALSMAASMLKSSGKSLDVVLNAAREKGYTLQGEMFSASNTLKFAEEEFNLTGQLLCGDLQLHKHDVISHLAKGLPALVPYDKDFNHEPTTRKGHSAHWAVLTGFVLVLPEDVNVPPCCHGDNISSNITYTPPWSDDMMAILPHLISRASLVFVFARQGKSRLLGAWQYDILARSNRNLIEYDPTLEGEYVFHEEGLAAGLADKAILLNDCNNL
ncbi:actin maturation protease-like isoform X1 [Lytechinus pictus]|uniref:actin maturation protease-like isoform X1 n=1 Tax=Lytechinus pictus TaxID=7653 RepID=UPI00240DAD38|nr:actin maturation protease-like [Lytechinus pictus]